MAPYRITCSPPAFVATMPPIVAESCAVQVAPPRPSPPARAASRAANQRHARTDDELAVVGRRRGPIAVQSPASVSTTSPPALDVSTDQARVAPLRHYRRPLLVAPCGAPWRPPSVVPRSDDRVGAGRGTCRSSRSRRSATTVGVEEHVLGAGAPSPGAAACRPGAPGRPARACPGRRPRRRTRAPRRANGASTPGSRRCRRVERFSAKGSCPGRYDRPQWPRAGI